MLVHKQGQKLELITRNRKLANNWFPELTEPLQKVKGNFLIDSEICVLDPNGKPDFERMRLIARPTRRQLENIQIFAFDLIMLNQKDLRALPLIERKSKLQKLLTNAPPRINYVQHIEEKGVWLYDQIVKHHGLEGIVAKRASAPYIGARSRDWLKIKLAGLHDGWNRRRVK